MHTFDPSHVIVSDECHVVYRKAGLIGLELRGNIDNERSDRWRQSLEDEIVRGGFPDYFAFDGTLMQTSNSAASALRSAMFVRGLMRRARRGVVCMPLKGGGKLAVSRLLALAGVSNVIIVSTSEAFARALDQIQQATVPDGAA
jgi:hypothetical protein